MSEGAAAARLDVALVLKRTGEAYVRDFFGIVVGGVVLVVLPGAVSRAVIGGDAGTLLTILRYVLAMIYAAMVGHGVVSRLSGRALGPAAFVREGMMRAQPGVQVALLAGAAVVLGLTVHLFARGGTVAGWMLNSLLLTAGLIGVCALMPLVPVAVAERLTPMAAFGRAAVLTRHNRNRILGVALVAGLTLAPVAALAMGFAGEATGLALAVFELLAWSLAATVPAVVYAGLREAP